MALNFGSSSNPRPENHDGLLAALNAAVGEAVKKNNGKPPLWARAALLARFVGHVILGVGVLGSGLWAVGYILAWQNILPYTPEWWHGFAIAFAWWAVQVFTPPVLVLRRNRG